MEKLFIADFFLVLSVKSFSGSGALRTSRRQVIQKLLNILRCSSYYYILVHIVNYAKDILIGKSEDNCTTQKY